VSAITQSQQKAANVTTRRVRHSDHTHPPLRGINARDSEFIPYWLGSLSLLVQDEEKNLPVPDMPTLDSDDADALTPNEAMKFGSLGSHFERLWASITRAHDPRWLHARHHRIQPH